MGRHASIGFESTYGTAVAPTETAFYVASESVRLEKEFERIPLLSLNSMAAVEEIGQFVAGELEVLPSFEDFPYLWYWFLGDGDESGAGPYTHTFPPAAGLPSTLRTGISTTLEILRDSLNWRYAGCKAESLAFTIARANVGRATVGIVGKSEDTDQAAVSPTLQTWAPMLAKNLTVDLDAGTTLNGESLSLNCEWTNDRPLGWGSTSFVVEPVENGVLTVAGSMDLYITSHADFYDKYVSGAEVDLQFAITGTGTDTCTINLNNCRIIQATPTVSERDPLRATVEFESYYDTAATENIQVVIVNDNDDTALWGA